MLMITIVIIVASAIAISNHGSRKSNGIDCGAHHVLIIVIVIVKNSSSNRSSRSSGRRRHWRSSSSSRSIKTMNYIIDTTITRC